MWADQTHVRWTIGVTWREPDHGPSHTDWWAFRAPIGGALSVNEAVLLTLDVVDERTRRQLGIPRRQGTPDHEQWRRETNLQRAWWSFGAGDLHALEPLFRLPGIVGVPEL